MVIIDTNIIIDHLRQTDKSESLLTKLSLQEASIAISRITIQEVYQGKSTCDRDKELQLREPIEKLEVLSYSFEIAKMAGELMRDSKKIISFPDAAIAATAIVNDCKLLTLNKKDFENIAQLQLV